MLINQHKSQENPRLMYQCCFGFFQINFFHDHTKIILCPLMIAVTYIDAKKDFRTFRMPLIEQFGCCTDLVSRLRYAKTMVEKLLATKPALAVGKEKS